ncbi:MAG: hypothetical protein WAM14_23550 [Candidatus Nitrosopolaris sp.]
MSLDSQLRVKDSRMLMDKVGAVKETTNGVSTQYVAASFCNRGLPVGVVGYRRVVKYLQEL